MALLKIGSNFFQGFEELHVQTDDVEALLGHLDTDLDGTPSDCCHLYMTNGTSITLDAPVETIARALNLEAYFVPFKGDHSSALVRPETVSMVNEYCPQDEPVDFTRAVLTLRCGRHLLVPYPPHHVVDAIRKKALTRVLH